MRPGLPSSAVLHAALLAWILFGFPGFEKQEEQPAVEAMPIEFVPIADQANLRLGDKTAKPKDEITPKEVAKSAKEADGARAGTDAHEEPPPPLPEARPRPEPTPEPTPQKVAELPKPEPVKAPEPKPAPKSEPKEAKAEPVKAPEPKPAPAPTPKAPEPKPDLPKEAEKAKDVGEGTPPKPKEPPKDTKALDKLIEEQKKLDEKKAADAKAKADAEAKAKAEAKARADKAAADAKAKADAAAKQASASTSKAFSSQISDVLNKNATGSSQGREQKTASLGSTTGKIATVRMTQAETDGLIGQIKKCWNPPIGAADAGLKVTLRFSLNADGSLNGQPELIQAPAHPLGVSLAASARRALMQCGPYRMPTDKYSAWRSVEATFDPKDL